MKNFFAAMFLLICCLVVFLATVDLQPYLAPQQQETRESTSQPSEPTADISLEQPVATAEKETASPAASVMNQSIIPIVETTPLESAAINQATDSDETKSAAPEQVMSPDAIAENEFNQDLLPKRIESPLIQLEVTVLPEDEYPFSILLGTFLEQEIAELAVPIYQKRDILTHWVKVGLGEKGIRYRLFTGMFRSAEEAQQYLEQHQLTSGLVKPTYYSALVGVYRDKAQLTDNFVACKDIGVVPYILGTKQGDYLLYVGSFYTFIGATNQCHKLREAGLNCQPVKRSTIVTEKRREG